MSKQNDFILMSILKGNITNLKDFTLKYNIKFKTIYNPTLIRRQIKTTITKHKNIIPNEILESVAIVLNSKNPRQNTLKENNLKESTIDSSMHNKIDNICKRISKEKGISIVQARKEFEDILNNWIFFKNHVEENNSSSIEPEEIIDIEYEIEDKSNEFLQALEIYEYEKIFNKADKKTEEKNEAVLENIYKMFFP
ncbi:hypothetical protein [Sulfurimonas sp.]|uniref:hypothetical protein n=1 Tax=Sulfurimonas sp. TaxID=2022749 RepID=UPI0035668F59